MMFTIVTLLAVALQSAGASMRTIDRGSQSNVDDQKQAVARTAAEWEALWRQHSPDRPQPAVDLSKEMVVAVFLGSRNTAGYSIDIVSAKEDQGALIVAYRERQPAPGAVTAQIITTPYHMVAVPKSALPVKFQRAQ